MNKVILMGRLGADPELRRTANDFAVTSFSLAINRPKQKDGTQVTDWIDCVAWRHTAEFITRYFTKGRLMLVEGTLQVRSYDDKNGIRRKATEVLIDRVEFCGDSQSGGGGGAPRDNSNYSDGGFASSAGFGRADAGSFEMGTDDDFKIVDNDDDLPF